MGVTTASAIKSSKKPNTWTDAADVDGPTNGLTDGLTDTRRTDRHATKNIIDAKEQFNNVASKQYAKE